jgi:hypothetical protein
VPADFIIKTGDMLQVTMTPPAVVPMLIAPVPLIGTGTTIMVDKMPVCLQGDELPVMLQAPMPYMSPPFVIPGMGTLTIILLPTNLTIQSSFSKKPALLKGSTFQVMFNVSLPAMQPTPVGPIPDPVPVKPGTAQFITTNIKNKAG